MLRRNEDLMRARVRGAPIAFTRVLLGLALAVVTLESYSVLSRIAVGRLSYPLLGWLAPPSEPGAKAILLVGWLAAVCLVFGLLPSIMAPLGAATGVVTLLWDQQTYSSHLTLLTLLLCYLTFAESDQRFGLSTARHRGDGSVPWWPQLLVMTQVSICYLFAGLSKVQPTFLSGEPLAGWMWPTLPGAAYAALAWTTVVTEVGLSLALWIPRWRRLAVLAGLGLHLSIVVFLESENVVLVAFALTTIASYPLFLTRPGLGAAPQASGLRDRRVGPGIQVPLTALRQSRASGSSPA